ncbi:autotransporter domain-containing protein, partial [Candidatus Pelagibacter ubique]|nr:autotransporter domain-containing protein [Candidatus Pelagibacter ubique]
GTDTDIGHGINVTGTTTITTLTNDGTISGTAAEDNARGIFISNSDITTLTNTGTISSTAGDQFSIGILFATNSTITTLTNDNTISGTSARNAFGVAAANNSTITTLTNNDTISGTATVDLGNGIFITRSEITNLTNDGTISGTATNDAGYGIYNFNNSTITTLTNNDTISGTAGAIGGVGVVLSGTSTLTTLTNAGTISGTAGTSTGYGIVATNDSILTTLTNSGTISGTAGTIKGYGVVVDDDSTLTTLTNTGTITGTATADDGGGVKVDQASSVITTLNNHGTITGTAANGAGGVIVDRGGVITTLLNTGTITGTATGAEGHGVFLQDTTSSITTLTNTGTITGSDATNEYDIRVKPGQNNGITNFNNLQSDLTYDGVLPGNYSTILQGDNYGKITFSTPVKAVGGDTVYTPYAGSGNTGVYIKAGTYTNVMTGMADANLAGTTTVTGTVTGDGTDSVGTATWTLTNPSSTNWDLTILGSYAYIGHANTQLALNQTSQNIGGVFNNMEASANFAKTATFDCNIFSENGCISFGGRITNSDGTDTAATLVLGKKIDDNFRVSGYVDQTINHDNYKDINVDSNIPLIGLTGVWNKNKDHQGLQIRVANSYQSNDAEITRAVVGSSELAKGDTTVSSQSYTAEASYQITNSITESSRPFVAVKYMKTEMDGYTEKNVGAPVTYSDMDQDNISAIIGVKTEKKVSSKVTLKSSLGLEKDLNSNDAKLQGAITNLAAFNSAAIGSEKNKIRPLVSMGANINLESGQRIEIEGVYQELRYKKDDATTVYVTYTLPF